MATHVSHICAPCLPSTRPCRATPNRLPLRVLSRPDRRRTLLHRTTIDRLYRQYELKEAISDGFGLVCGIDTVLAAGAFLAAPFTGGASAAMGIEELLLCGIGLTAASQELSISFRTGVSQALQDASTMIAADKGTLAALESELHKLANWTNSTAHSMASQFPGLQVNETSEMIDTMYSTSFLSGGSAAARRIAPFLAKQSLLSHLKFASVNSGLGRRHVVAGSKSTGVSVSPSSEQIQQTFDQMHGMANGDANTRGLKCEAARCLEGW